MIFPQFANKKYGYIDLNEESQKWLLKNSKRFLDAKSNPLIDSVISSEMVNEIHKEFGIDFSYGGWLENRSGIWKDTYLEEVNMPIHLGVDINVPAGTEVAADFEAVVMRVDDDYPEEGGWGPRIIVKHAEVDVYMIYGHLDRNMPIKIGETIQAGQVFARIGAPPFNGNWFPHVHVQTMSSEAYKHAVETDFQELDGYGSVNDISNLAHLFPDPLQYIKLS